MISLLILGIYSDNLIEFRDPEKTEIVKSSPIVIFEGILSLYDAKIRELMDIKIFVLTDDDIRLARRCKLSSRLTYS